MILVVDDEEGVRDLAARILEQAGYEVVVAEDPAQAAAVWRDSSKQLELVLTDVVMPGRSGVEMVSELRGMFPRLPVVFMSGYPGRPEFDEGIIPADAHFLEKPFMIDGLLQIVNQALGKGCDSGTPEA